MDKKPTRKHLLVATGYDREGNIVAHHSERFHAFVSPLLASVDRAVMVCGKPAKCTRVVLAIELPEL